MTGPEHYQEAEQLVRHSREHTDSGDPRDQAIAEVVAAQALVHATLAQAAAVLDAAWAIRHETWEEVMRHG